MGDPNRPEPTAQGSFAKTPFAHLLVYAYDRKLSGTIDLVAGQDVVAEISFVDGWPTKVRTTEPMAYLGEVLVDLGVLIEAQHAASIRALANETRLYGQVLLSTGAITPEQLDLGLRTQFARKMRFLIGLPATTAFRYYAGYDALAGFGEAAASGHDPFPIVWTSIREEPSWDHVQTALTRIGESSLRLASDADLARFEFEKNEQAAVEFLRARPRRLQQLTQAGIVSARPAQLLAYCLMITKQVELIRESDVPPSSMGSLLESQRHPGAMPSARPATAVSAHPAPVPGARTASAPAMPRVALPPEVHAKPTVPSMSAVVDPAMTRKSSVVPPAMKPSTRPPGTLPPASAIVDHSEASGAAGATRGMIMLGESGIVEEKQAYFEMMHQPEGMDLIAEAASEYQNAEAAFAAGDLAKAEALSKRATEHNPDHAEAVALYAWLSSMKPGKQGLVPTQILIERIDQALRLNPKIDRAYYFRGMLHKRLDRDEEAIEDFRAALALNPGRVEARTEIQAIETKRAQKTEEKPGLLGKFFKR